MLSASLIATTAFAGGPVVIEEETAVVAERPATSVPIVPILVIVGLCLVLCGGNGDDDDEPVLEPAE